MNFTKFEQNNFYSKLIWLFPLSYLIHILEESNGFYDWVTNVLKGEMSESTFYINNSIFMSISLFLCFIVSRTKSKKTLFALFLWVSAQIFWNSVFHIYTQYHFREYSPGYFTAIFLYLPTYYYLSYLAIRDKHLPLYFWLISFFVGSFGMWFVIWGGLYHFQKFPWNFWLP